MDVNNEPGQSRPCSDMELGRLPSRLKTALKGMSIRSFAQKSGVSEGTLRNIMSGTMPRIDNIVQIACAANVSVEWLATGQGPMRKIDHPKDVQEARSTVKSMLESLAHDVQVSVDSHEYGDDVEYKLDHEVENEIISYVEQLAKKALIDNNSPNQGSVEFAMVPHYDVELSAGHGTVVEREAEIGRIAFRRDWLRQKGLSVKDLVVTRVKGDSMEPTIKDGALVLVDTRIEFPKADGIYVIQNDGELFAKRVQVDLAANGVSIISDNPSYKPVHLDRDDVKRLYIIGKVVWVGQEV